jgi:MOSC domain-containing protein YiiM
LPCCLAEPKVARRRSREAKMEPRRAIVEAVCISSEGLRIAKTPVPEARVGPHGIEGDRHATEMRMSRRAGAEVPNRRQWSAVSTEEVEAVCRELGVMPFAFGAMGENLRLRGLPLADLPDGAVFELPSGCRLRVSEQNDPCENAAAELGVTYGPTVERLFVKAAYGRRGVVGTVLAPGTIRPGDEVRIVLPAASGLG